MISKKNITLVFFETLKKIFKTGYFFFKHTFYPTACVCNMIFCMLHRDYSHLHACIKGLEQYCKETGIIKGELSKDESIVVFPKEYYDKRCEDVSNIQYNETTKYGRITIPSIYYILFHDVIVIGGNNFVIKQHTILMPNFTDRTSRDFVWTNSTISTIHNNKTDIRYKKEINHLDTALHLLNPASANYFHFMIEVLPKLVLYSDTCFGEAQVPILVDACIKNTNMQVALDILNDNKHKIIYVDSGTTWHVDNLVYITPVTWMPMNMKKRAWPSGVDYGFSIYATKKIRDELKLHLVDHGYRKVYLARYKLKNKRLINDQIISEICAEHGFKIIFPEELSLIDMLSYVYYSEYIIGCAGAAFANAIVAANKQMIYMIVPRTHESLLWPTMIKNMGVNLAMIDARVVVKTRNAASDQFEVSPNDVETVLSIIDNA